jgi:hypothetical protein
MNRNNNLISNKDLGTYGGAVLVALLLAGVVLCTEPGIRWVCRLILWLSEVTP